MNPSIRLLVWRLSARARNGLLCRSQRDAISIARVENLLPQTDLRLEWFVDLALAVFIGVIPKAVIAMPIVHPAGVIHDRVNANAFDRNSHFHRRRHFFE